MPHFGLMDAGALGPEGAPLQRSRLHVRGGKRRLRQGKISAGVAALYDALTSAMEWFCSSPVRRSRLRDELAEPFPDDRALYHAFVRAGILDGNFDFDSFKRVVDRGLDAELAEGDAAGIPEGVVSVLTQLGVLPFDEGELPPEDPRTL